MKVIYKKDIGERIIEEVDKAKKNRKAIDYISLTNDEYNELVKNYTVNVLFNPMSITEHCWFFGIRIRVENP